jgi:hypothetical protein
MHNNSYQNEPSRSLMPSLVTEGPLSPTNSGRWGLKVAALGCAFLGLSGMLVILNMMHQSQSSTNIPMASSSNRQYELLGKSKEEKSSCEKGDYRKRTLQLAYEIPMVALFRDMKGQRKHEASDVITVSASQLVRFI